MGYQMRKKYLSVAAIAAAVVLLDQYTKLLVLRHFILHESVTVIPGFFNLTYVRNKGAAFGILSGINDGWRTVFFVGLSLIALTALAYLVRKTGERLPLIAYACISGGAVGNLIDRVRFGEVVDFVEWYYQSFHWPAFNIADSAITIGVGLLMVDMLFLQRQDNVKNEG